MLLFWNFDFDLSVFVDIRVLIGEVIVHELLFHLYGISIDIDLVHVNIGRAYFHFDDLHFGHFQIDDVLEPDFLEGLFEPVLIIIILIQQVIQPILDQHELALLGLQTLNELVVKLLADTVNTQSELNSIGCDPLNDVLVVEQHYAV